MRYIMQNSYDIGTESCTYNRLHDDARRKNTSKLRINVTSYSSTWNHNSKGRTSVYIPAHTGGFLSPQYVIMMLPLGQDLLRKRPQSSIFMLIALLSSLIRRPRRILMVNVQWNSSRWISCGTGHQERLPRILLRAARSRRLNKHQ